MSVPVPNQNIKNEKKEKEDFIVDPWTVKGSVDYMKLIEKFGTEPIKGSLIERFERVTKYKVHHFIRRGLVFSNQDLSKVLDEVEKGNPVYLYTGRGPSSESMHLGHLVPFMLTKYLQDALGAMVIIQMSDDEKFYFKSDRGSIDELEYYHNLTRKNALDIIACGFNPDKTLIFSNLEMFGKELYFNTSILMRATSGNQIEGIYGLNLDNNIGQLFWPAVQCAPAFSTSFSDIFGKIPRLCLVPMAIDQAPYFRMARDLASNVKCFKPASIHSQFLPGLEGPNGKMSSSNAGQNTALFLDMPLENIKKTIKRSAFSGGKITVDDHRKYGGDINIDVCYQYQTYFNDDDQQLEKIAKDYTSGDLLSGQLKEMTADLIYNIIKNHQENKNKITPDILELFFNRNRKFDLSLPNRSNNNITEKYTDYEKYGINFDLTFGYKCKA